ncbi:indolepyruvate oxidoreductase subunit beta [Candidatus Bathyarchaeota archaeon ex4484_205]|nr:MAG: indolepyruvate oxidoreductase subunit beta [Candidatus Bathyarchaeota archaeon ex4484_205]
MEKFSRRLIFIGVGGQGVVLVTRIISQSVVEEGYRVVIGETHGQAIRGGTTLTHMLYGEEEIYSPLIMKGTADAIIGFEPMETVRALPYLRRGGVVVYNRHPVHPVTVKIGEEEYPTPGELFSKINSIDGRVYGLDATKIAEELGSRRVANILLLGVMTGAFDLGIQLDTIRESIMRNVPPGTVEANLKAFNKGIEYAKREQPSRKHKNFL